MTNQHHKNMTSITLDEISSFITPRSVDTLMLSKLLRRLNFSEEQAEVVSEIVKQTNANAEKIAIETVNANEEKNKISIQDLATKKDLELEIEKVRSDLSLKIAEVDSRITKVEASIIRWVAGLMIANTGLLFTLIKFFN